MLDVAKLIDFLFLPANRGLLAEALPGDTALDGSNGRMADIELGLTCPTVVLTTFMDTSLEDSRLVSVFLNGCLNEVES